MPINYPRIVALFILFAVTPDAVTANQVLGVPPEDDLGAVQLSTHDTIPNDPSLLRTPVHSTVDEAPQWLDEKFGEVTAKLTKLLEGLYKHIGIPDIGFDIDKDYMPGLTNISSQGAVGFFATFMSSLDTNNDRHLSWDEYVNGSAIIAGLKTLYADIRNNVGHLDIQDLFDPVGLKLFGIGDSLQHHLSKGGDADQFPLEDLVTRIKAGWDSNVNETNKILSSVTLAIGAGILLACPKCFDGLDAPKL